MQISTVPSADLNPLANPSLAKARPQLHFVMGPRTSPVSRLVRQPWWPWECTKAIPKTR